MLRHFDQGSSHHNRVQIRFQIRSQAREPAIAAPAFLTPTAETLADSIVSHGPNSADKASHGAPVRAAQSTASSTVRLSYLG